MVTLPHDGSPALSEMINRSLVHIRTSKSLATRHREPGEECDFEIALGMMMRMCWIPPGEFVMGYPPEYCAVPIPESERLKLGHVGAMRYCEGVGLIEIVDEGALLHRVTITDGFWLGKYEVTQAQWVAVMGSNPSCFSGPNLPVECVSWDDISKPGGFLERTNRLATEGARFSLPTEAQWEYACRAGTTITILIDPSEVLRQFVDARRAGTKPALSNATNLSYTEGDSVTGWFNDNKTHPGGLKRANAWGLHDMLGNLLEWCADWHGPYPHESVVDPIGPESGSNRVVRGGSFSDSGPYSSVAHRDEANPAKSYKDVGFRIARSSVP